MSIVETFRYRRALYQPLVRSNKPSISFTTFGFGALFLGTGKLIIVMALLSCLVLWLLFGFDYSFDESTKMGALIGFWSAAIYLFFPYVSLLCALMTSDRNAVWRNWLAAPLARRVGANIPVVVGIVYLLELLDYWTLSIGEFFIGVPISAFFLTLALDFLLKIAVPTGQNNVHAPKERAKLAKSVVDSPFCLWIGESTGQFVDLWHGANVAAHQPVALRLEDCAQNVLILGAIGSGKTTRGIHPLLLQLLDQHCGGLIFDIKGDFGRAVGALTAMTHRVDDVITIGPKQRPFNLIKGLTPEMASSFLKSTFFLSKGHADGFWIDTASELCRNVLGILSFVPRYYNLNALYHYLFDPHSQESILASLDEENTSLSEDKAKLLRSYQYYCEHVFKQFDEKVKAGVLATISQVLSSFNHPELITAFCSSDTQSMESVLEGTVFLVDLPLAEWGLGAKVICTLLKLRFYNVMQRRLTTPAWNQDNPAFFICDEFQEIVSANKDGLSDLNFWDKSRSSKTIGIISAQSISSFYAAIGDRDVAHALLQNFRQKLCFRTEDDWTIQYCNRLLGQVEVQQKTISRTKGQSSSGFNHTSQESDGVSISTQQRQVLDAQVFRNLSPDEVIALLSFHGYAVDDVLTVEPIYL